MDRCLPTNLYPNLLRSEPTSFYPRLLRGQHKNRRLVDSAWLLVKIIKSEAASAKGFLSKPLNNLQVKFLIHIVSNLLFTFDRHSFNNFSVKIFNNIPINNLHNFIIESISQSLSGSLACLPGKPPGNLPG